MKNNRLISLFIIAIILWGCKYFFREDIKLDFASFYYSAKAVNQNVNIYDFHKLNELSAKDSVYVFPYIYTPVLAVILNPFSSLSPQIAQGAWTTANIIIFISILLIIFFQLKEFPAFKGISHYVIVAATAAAVIALPYNFILFTGQVDFIILLLFFLSFHFAKNKKDFLAGGLLGLAAMIKMSPAILLIYFIIEKQYRVVAGFAATVIVIFLVTITAGAWNQWLNYITYLREVSDSGFVAGLGSINELGNCSFLGFFSRMFGYGLSAKILSSSASITFLAISILVIKKYKTENQYLVILPLIVTMILSSPITWRQHSIYYLPSIIILLLTIYSRFSGIKKFGIIVFVVIISKLSWLYFPDWIIPLREIQIEIPGIHNVLFFSHLIIFLVGILILRRNNINEKSTFS